MKRNRLSKVLAAAGVASRRACEALIFRGDVQVNGEVVLTPQTSVDPEKDSIHVGGQPLARVEDKVYYLHNKPSGYICSTKKSSHSRRVLDLFEGEPYRLFTVGRLDAETEGLLIVTNDGHFAQQVIHPASNIRKEYLAKVDREIGHEHLVAIS